MMCEVNKVHRNMNNQKKCYGLYVFFDVLTSVPCDNAYTEGTQMAHEHPGSIRPLAMLGGFKYY